MTEREKRIEELAQFMCETGEKSCSECKGEPDVECAAWNEAVRLYDAGYRKEKKIIEYSAKRCRKIIDESAYKGVKYFILNLGTHPTAYVENVLGAKSYADELLNGIDVHGGFTFYGEADWGEGYAGKYLGWDYAHSGDYAGYDIKYEKEPVGKKWSYEEILTEVHSVIDQMLFFQENETEALKEEKKMREMFCKDCSIDCYDCNVLSVCKKLYEIGYRKRGTEND